MSDHLFKEWNATAFKPPSWFTAHGLNKYKPLVTMLRTSWEHWARADRDGLSNLAPFIVIYNKPPAEIKKIVGGHTWHQIRTASAKINANRMVLRLVGGWSLEEAMLWPVRERKHAQTYLRNSGKSELVIACRHAGSDGLIMENLETARDFVRLGGTIDPQWGRKRLKREHDALAMKKAMQQSDPTPWEKAWFCDVGDYTVTLLKSETELAFEGIAQRHCCRSYALACREGKETVFSIQGPERATASWNAPFMQMQIKGFANRSVSTATRLAMETAFDKYSDHLAELRAKGDKS